MTSINFLHLSDLHIGDKYQKGLISQTKKVLFEDIEYILSKLKTLELVFFTGDFVQRGTSEEFILLEEFLKELWTLFSKYGQNPYLLCVPGNHDLERVPDLHNAEHKILSNWVNENIKDEYFWNSPNSYHDFIKERFRNYDAWNKNTSIRKPEMQYGYLPGDFYCTLHINNINIGIVGLNSTFLQLQGGDFKHKLGVYNKQINKLFEEKYFEWLKAQDISILMAHHSPEWFEPSSFNEFNREIYTRDSFIELLCGHMHEPASTTTATNGFPSKHIFVSPSLFGLEYVSSGLKRIHGYTAGRYNVTKDRITKTIWPRISILTQTGLKIVQNEEFALDKDTASLTETLKDIGSSTLNLDDDFEKIESIKSEAQNLFSEDKILDKGLARSTYKEISSHKNVRLTERILCKNQLMQKRLSCIVTAFGLAETEFIGSILSDADINSENCFSISCEKISSIDELIEAFKNTFSKSITQFFDILNSLDRPLLVLNNLNINLIKNNVSLNEFVQTIFDFSPKVKIIIVTDEIPVSQSFPSIQLTPLDIPGIKIYIENSQELQLNLTFLENEKIHRISSGIPLYVDKVIEQLKFRPLSDLGDMEFDTSTNEFDNHVLPKTLLNEIKILNDNESKQGIRKFVLLSVLSLLHNGETYDQIKRYDPTLPFHPEDITYLLNNKLIETIQVNSIFENENRDSELVKIIKVPRLIRDYISSLLTIERKVEIYKNVCNIYLGSNWRNSIKLIQAKGAELDLVIHQNLQIVIRFLLLHGVEKENEIETNRMVRISIELIKYFSSRGDYKEAAFLSEETLLLIKDVHFTDLKNERTQLMKKLGENLRMTDDDKAVPILKALCEDSTNSLSKSDRNNIRLSLAYAYERLNNQEEALHYSDLIKRNEKDKDRSIYLSAESIIANFIEDENLRIKKLSALKNKAEKLGYNTLRANIMLQINDDSTDVNQLKEFDKIISASRNDTYTKVRAIVAKARIVFNTKSIDKISSQDLLSLNISYSYCFYQRLNILVTKCHKLTWDFWFKQRRYDQLINLFRYSSFVWRLCGEIELEKMYLNELNLNQEFNEWFKLNRTNVNSAYYEQRIFALFSIDNSPKLLS